MGDVIKQLEVTGGIKEEKLNLYFDSCSPFTFIKMSSAQKVGKVFELPKELEFEGIGDGVFTSKHITSIEIKLLDVWCRHLCYVISDELLKDEDILIGHDFMQRLWYKA